MLVKQHILNLLQSLNLSDVHHYHPEQVLPKLRAIQDKNPDQVKIEAIGHSREGWELYGVRLGDTTNKPVIAATGNCHAEEAIGTATLLHLADALVSNLEFQPILDSFSFAFIPQANPDGTLRNWEWLKLTSPTYRDYLRYYCRDNRSEDIEHGIPTAETHQESRPESEAIARFYRRFPKLHAYISLHSANMFPGTMFLVSQKPPGEVTDFLKSVAQTHGLDLYADNDNGMGGIEFIEPGFYSIPRFEVMRERMLAGGDPERVKNFKLNSCQFVQSECDCQLALVSELPYFQLIELQDLTPVADYLPVAGDREAIKRQIVSIQEKSAQKRLDLLMTLKAFQFHSPLFNFYEDKANWLIGNSVGNRRDCAKVRGTPVLMKDLVKVRLENFVWEAEVSAMMLRLFQESDLPTDQITAFTAYYEEKFTQACDQIDRITPIQTLPLAVQAEVQAGIILSGLFLP